MSATDATRHHQVNRRDLQQQQTTHGLPPCEAAGVTGARGFFMHRIIATLLLTAMRSFSGGMASSTDARGGKARLAATSTTVSLKLKYLACDAKSTRYFQATDCPCHDGGALVRRAQTGETHNDAQAAALEREASDYRSAMSACLKGSGYSVQ
jgi:hypothetical protein